MPRRRRVNSTGTPPKFPNKPLAVGWSVRHNSPMRWRSWLTWIGLAGLLYLSFRAFAWWGFSLTASGILFWLLLHATRVMKTMESAAQRPMGQVDNAVMLHATLHPGQRLLEVIGLAHSLGQRTPHEDPSQEAFVWQDGHGDQVWAVFAEGRLTQSSLRRAASGEAPQDGA